MKAKVKSTGDIVEVSESHSYCCGELGYWDGNSFYYPEELDFNLDNQYPEATISGWVVRTKRGELIFSDKPPVGKSNVIWYYREGTDVRQLSESGLFGNDIFPSLTWQDEPIEVEIQIKPKKS